MHCGLNRENVYSQTVFINQELKLFSEWCKRNTATLNLEKTKCMLFTPSVHKFRAELQGSLPKLYTGDHPLGYVKNYCYLGVELDRSLPIDSQLDHIVGKVRPLLYMLSKLLSTALRFIAPPPKEEVKNCLAKLYEAISETKKRKKHNTIVHGDFNINYGNNTCRWAKELKNWETSLHLSQLVKIPTRVTERTSSMIDLCFTDLNHISLSGVLNTNMSDHFPTFVLIKKAREVREKTSFIGRSYANFSLARIEESLSTHLPPQIVDDPNLEWDQLEEAYQKVADEICPLRKFEIHNDRPEYFSDKLSTAIKKRDMLFRKARAKKCRATWDKARKKRKEVKALLKKDKKEFIAKGIDQCRDNANKFWRNVSKLLNRKKTSAINEILDSHGKVVKGKEAANEINRYFCNIGPNLATKVPLASLDFATIKVDGEFEWGRKIRSEDTIREIQKLDIKKSSGILQLSCKILKLCLLQTAVRFTDLLNSCIDKGVFPRRWKQALVVPIPKGKNSKLVTNIRPISLLPVTGKILGFHPR